MRSRNLLDIKEEVLGQVALNGTILTQTVLEWNVACSGIRVCSIARAEWFNSYVGKVRWPHLWYADPSCPVRRWALVCFVHKITSLCSFLCSLHVPHFVRYRSHLLVVSHLWLYSADCIIVWYFQKLDDPLIFTVIDVSAEYICTSLP